MTLSPSYPWYAQIPGTCFASSDRIIRGNVFLRALGELDQYRSKYDYLIGLTRRGWAYEHLRRNTPFRKAAYQHQSGFVRATLWEHDMYLLDMLGPQPEAEDWGLIVFPDPDHSALFADVFWSERVYPNHIRVNVRSRLEDEVDEIFQAATGLCRIRQLTDWNRFEHVLIQGRCCAIQIRCNGLSLRSAHPVKMSFELSGPAQMEREFRNIKKASRAYQPPDPARQQWTPRTISLRDGIIALDVTDAGLPLRAAAEIIHGPPDVAEKWADSGRHMKDRLHKRLMNARLIRDGGYRAYLQKKL